MREERLRVRVETERGTLAVLAGRRGAGDRAVAVGVGVVGVGRVLRERPRVQRAAVDARGGRRWRLELHIHFEERIRRRIIGRSGRLILQQLPTRLTREQLQSTSPITTCVILIITVRRDECVNRRRAARRANGMPTIRQTRRGDNSIW